MKFIMGQEVNVTFAENGQQFNKNGKIAWDYNNGIYDVEIEDGKVIPQHEANIFPIAGFIQTPPNVENLNKKTIEEELQSIEARRAYLMAIKDEQPENDVSEKVKVEAGELTEDHSETIFAPAIENEEQQKEFVLPHDVNSEIKPEPGEQHKEPDNETKAAELIKQALELLEGK